ncbi:MAG: hypothetical protein HY913_09355 [Desulfomonile tiedjei]|nr:hypothetical protein [Desulfomonile tiedjei]
MYVPDMIDFLANLRQTGAIGEVKHVLEIGAQEIFCTGFEPSVKRFVQAFCPGLEIPGGCLKELSHGPARNLYQFVGCSYSCVDVIEDPDHVFLRKLFDVNFDEVSAIERNKYDLVTNLGVTHHAFNQYNSFKAVHDFATCGGYMFHYLPFMGRYDDLFFYHQPIFFERLAMANNYEIVGLWLFLPGDHLTSRAIVPWNRRVWDYIRLPLAVDNQYYVLAAVFRKAMDHPFCAPETVSQGVAMSKPVISSAMFNLFGNLRKRCKIDKPGRFLAIGDPILAEELDRRHLGTFIEAMNPKADYEGRHDQDVSSFNQLALVLEKMGCECEILLSTVHSLGREVDNCHDLNQFRVPQGQRGGFDLVCNFGVSNNILHQQNFFELAHDYTSVGGLMVHIVPFMGFSDQDYFMYDVVLFEELAHTNGYELLGKWLSIPSGVIPLEEGVYQYLRVPEKERSNLLWLCVALTKRHDTPFMIPFQAFYKRFRDKLVGERYKMVLNGEMCSDTTTPWIPRRERLRDEAAKVRDVVLPAITEEVYGYINKCGVRMPGLSLSGTAPKSKLAPTRNRAGISIIEATYGWNCLKEPAQESSCSRVARGNVTAAVALECDGEEECEFYIDVNKLGDPASGLSKDFNVKWRYGDSEKVYEAYVEAEAHGKTVRISRAGSGLGSDGRGKI